MRPSMIPSMTRLEIYLHSKDAPPEVGKVCRVRVLNGDLVLQHWIDEGWIEPDATYEYIDMGWWNCAITPTEKYFTDKAWEKL